MAVVSTMGRWLDQYPWSAFATLTFRRPRWKDALKFMRPLLLHVAAASSARGAARSFVAEEHGKDGVRLHLHALIFVPGYPDLTDWWRYWHKKFGRARISAYDPARGATAYISKYVTKEVNGCGRYAIEQVVNGKVVATPNRMLWRRHDQASIL